MKVYVLTNFLEDKLQITPLCFNNLGVVNSFFIFFITLMTPVGMALIDVESGDPSVNSTDYFIIRCIPFFRKITRCN